MNHSLVVVACLWAALGLLVTINIAIDGVHHFYGPAGYCKLRLRHVVQFLVGLNLTWPKGAGYRSSIQSSVLRPISRSCGQLHYSIS